MPIRRRSKTTAAGRRREIFLFISPVSDRALTNGGKRRPLESRRSRQDRPEDRYHSVSVLAMIADRSWTQRFSLPSTVRSTDQPWSAPPSPEYTATQLTTPTTHTTGRGSARRSPPPDPPRSPRPRATSNWSTADRGRPATRRQRPWRPAAQTKSTRRRGRRPAATRSGAQLGLGGTPECH